MTDQEKQIRYIHRETNVEFFAEAFSLYGCPDEVRREVLVSVDSEGNEDWRELQNKPMPGVEFQRKGEAEDADGYVMPYDAPVDVWASDTHSGGPANFHGNGGGSDNPRNPRLEGEEPGDLERAMASYNQAQDA